MGNFNKINCPCGRFVFNLWSKPCGDENNLLVFEDWHLVDHLKTEVKFNQYRVLISAHVDQAIMDKENKARTLRELGVLRRSCEYLRECTSGPGGRFNFDSMEQANSVLCTRTNEVKNSIDEGIERLKC